MAVAPAAAASSQPWALLPSHSAQVPLALTALSLLPGYYVYLDEDELPEVLGGAARCQDTYQDWISLYCWAPFHATLMTTPEGSRCHWDQISRWVSAGPGGAECTPRVGPLQRMWSHAAPPAAPTVSSLAVPSCWPSSSPAPGPAPSSMPSSCRFMLNTSPTARGLSPPGQARCPPGWLWLWPWGSAASYPLQQPLCSAEPQRGLTPQPLLVPMPVRSQQLPPSFPALGTEGWAGGAGDRAEQWWGSGHPWEWSGSPWHWGGGSWAWGSGCLHLPQSRGESGEGDWAPDPAWDEPFPSWHGAMGMPD
ncbi:uncharacterized protein LOC133281723 isoform X2 [Pezoporus flaviventris]|uniref:uncharacterized protein LOC133281723 isoform X2 n=1 Tax=Pezoporus flaviventris TaxID=889875 RepID=UPI002AB10628|nr:uncharacterized protein LOC133281723 isoform X2 [Pezoporus flaviventris]